MIFKTFDSDIDKISAKWGIFGKSFNDIGNAIVGRIKDINNGFQATDDLLGSFKNTDSVWKRLYPSKETIQSQMIDIDALYPEKTDAQFTKLLSKLTQQQNTINTTKGSWSDYFKNLGEGEKWQIEFVQNTDLQKASLDDVKKAYDVARDGAIAHNAALKQQTLSAKASTIALKGLAIAGNMLAMWAISEVIGGVINYLDELSHKAQNIADEAKSRFSESNEKNEEYKENIKSLDEYKQKYQEILNSNDSEINKRKSLLELQGNINKLVGTQCDGLDLVNGKLDDQISKIEKITKSQKEQYYQNSVGNYTNAKSAANSSTGQLEDDGVTKVYSESNPDKELVKILQENGYGNLYNSSSGNFFADLFSFGNSGGSINIDDGIDAYGNILISLEDRVANLKKLQEVLLKNGKGDSDLYGVVTSQIQKWEDSLKSQKSSAEDVIKSYIDLNANPENINSVDDYKKYIDAFTDEIKKDKNVSQIIKDGVLNDEDIKTIVNDYISVLDGFSEWYDKWKNKTTKTANNSDSKTKSFDEVWSGLKESEQNKFTKLVNNGKLTAETFDKIGSSATALKETGLSVEDLCDKIRSLVGLEQKLTNLSNSMKKVGTAYKDYKKNGYVSSTSLNSMPDSFKNLDGYSKFSKIAGSKKSSKSDIQDAFNDIVTEYVKTSNILDDVTEKNKNKVITGLRDAGIINAKKVVDAFLNSSDKQFSKLSSKFNKMSNSELQNFIKMLNQKGKVSGDFYKKIGVNNANMINGLSKQYQTDLVNWIKLCEKKRDAYNQLVKAVGGNNTKEAKKNYVKLVTKDESKLTAEDMGAYEAAQKGGIITKTDKKGKVTAATKYDSQQKKLEKKLGLKLAKVNFDVDYKPTSASGSGSGSGSKGSKGSKDSAKKSKQVIDWIERRLKNLQSTIDYTSSKLQNLFTVESKNSNLDKQIKTTTKLINEYGIAAEKYQQKANKVAKASTKTVKGKKGKKKKVKTKGLSKDVISKIKTGKLTKKTKLSSLIKEYGEDTANKIQSYIDYYDKAQEAKKNKQDQIAKKRELQVQKQTNIQEEADKKSALYQAERELAQLKDKNGWIKKEIDSTIESYDAQIKAAEIQKDTAEKDKLIAEKKKALLALYQEEVDNIKAMHETNVQSLENGVVNNNGTRRSYGQKYYQNQVALAESRGNKVNKDWYRQQSSIENKKISEYTAERNQLIKELAKFTEGTTEWYNLQSDIQACDDSINESLIAQAENTKAMRELTEKMEQEYDDWFSNLNNEISFIASLKSGDKTDSDKGTFTDAGNLAMYSQSLLFQSSNAEKEYWKTQTNKLQKLVDANASVAQIQAAGFEFNSLEEVKNALTSYRQNWQDAIKEEKQAEEEITNLMKEKYEAEKDYLQDIVDAKKEALSVEKD